MSTRCWLPFAILVAALPACGDSSAEAREALAHGRTLAAEGRTGEARAAFERAGRADPNLWEARMNVARIALDAGDFEEARSLAQSVVDVVPERPYPLELLGRAQHALGDDEAAIASFDQAIQQDPARARLHFEIGRMQESLGRRDDAITSYRALVQAAPRALEVRIVLAHALLPEGPRDEARRMLGQARVLAGPSSPLRPTIDGLLAWCDRLDGHVAPGGTQGVALAQQDAPVGGDTGAPYEPQPPLPGQVRVDPVVGLRPHVDLRGLRIPGPGNLADLRRQLQLQQQQPQGPQQQAAPPQGTAP